MYKLPLSMKSGVYYYFKENVKGHENTPYYQVLKRLNRNYILGTTVYKTENIEKRNYGNLEIVVDLKQMKIIHIKNNKEKIRHSYINKVEKEKLNKLFEIV